MDGWMDGWTKKTEVLWCASSRRQDQIPAVPLRIGADNVMPVSSVRDLGVYLDADVSMSTHISRTVLSCFGILRQQRSVQRSLPRHAVTSLVISLVLTTDEAGLLQLGASWPSSEPPEQASGCHQRICQADLLS